MLVRLQCVHREATGVGNAILICFGFVGLLSIYFGYRQLSVGQRAQQTQTAIQLHSDFFSSSELRAFLYRLDYSSSDRGWKFDPQAFPHSDDERNLDLVLYKLAFIGTLVQSGDMLARDLLWLRVETAIVLENEQVLAYLEWLQSGDQIPGHAAFSGAFHLYSAFFGKSGSAYEPLLAYLRRARRIA